MTMSRGRRGGIERSPGPATTTFPITTSVNTPTPSNRAGPPPPAHAAALEPRRVTGRLGGSVTGIALWGRRVGHGRWALAGGLTRPPRGGGGVRLEGVGGRTLPAAARRLADRASL